jgi:hypothetical protein
METHGQADLARRERTEALKILEQFGRAIASRL